MSPSYHSQNLPYPPIFLINQPNGSNGPNPHLFFFLTSFSALIPDSPVEGSSYVPMSVISHRVPPGFTPTPTRPPPATAPSSSCRDRGRSRGKAIRMGGLGGDDDDEDIGEDGGWTNVSFWLRIFSIRAPVIVSS